MMIETRSYEEVLPSEVKDHFSFYEVRNAARILANVAPEEWADIVGLLSSFRFDANMFLRSGGNNSKMAETLNNGFAELGWRECLYELDTKATIKFRHSKGDQPKTEDLGTSHTSSYWVDNRKGRVLLDVEWNAKDGNLDRDFAAYRAWHEMGFIDAAVLITKDREALLKCACELWARHLGLSYDVVYAATMKGQSSRTAEDKANAIPLDLKTTTTTNTKNAELRINLGEAGTCPILLVGISDRTWNGEEYKA
ncbi:BglII/BstYI family type II restriction endonuclease [Bifidobacterium olomucense]|uniref:Restriction endonuclease BglII n=1 Tax=Bifidobacterium olomucense TaxID=2675324 RepID=A0A7Y0HXG5_9BIFI|nr:BglII/BstYI family type II restriction endonuclease [Bifidobacterium sp. DSM 109959]NMM99376.1 restriction endonuclease BglII [Bifidobacterium sp. DSM 109959]